MNIVIREARARDQDALSALIDEVQALHVAHRPDVFAPIGGSQLAAWTLQLLESPESEIWVAEIEMQVRGYMGLVVRHKPRTPLTVERSWLELDQIAVHSGFRGLGIARALVSTALAQAKAKGIAGVELSSWAFNEAAHRTFAKLGFVPKAVRFEQADSQQTPPEPK